MVLENNVLRKTGFSTLSSATSPPPGMSWRALFLFGMQASGIAARGGEIRVGWGFCDMWSGVFAKKCNKIFWRLKIKFLYLRNRNL